MSAHTTAEKEEYLYVIYGVIPEAMPPVAYRRAGRSELTERKIIKCPYCRERLTDIDRHTSIEIYRIKKGKPNKPVPGQFFKRCTACKHDVGIVMKLPLNDKN